MSLSTGDRRQLEEAGIAAAEAKRQLALLADPPRPFRVLRPCTAGDGIRVPDEEERWEWVAAYRRACRAGRASKMVPASGAATRMFRSLLALAEERPFPTGAVLAQRAAAGDGAARDVQRLRREMPFLPFGLELAERLAALGISPAEPWDGGEVRRALAVLLEEGDGGMGLAALPKGLVPFHRYDGELRTPLVEHLVEGRRYLADDHGRCRLHFTVPPEHRAAFLAAAEAARQRFEPLLGVRFRIGFSVQDPATDTLALDEDGEPFRLADGRLLLRPGGHGALLGILARLDGDLVFVKNVDNVRPESAHALVAHWQEALGGLLVELEERCHALVRRLRGMPDEDAVAAATAFAADELGLPERAHRPAETAERATQLLALLDRPLRVCGVVPNQGEPGGGPFWVERPDGAVSPQIVEKAEMPEDDAAGRAALAASTHFNPVQIACALRDADGEPFDLPRFVDDRAVFIARKSHEGRALLALERPGLWNGAMAGWNTVFVEVPAATFAPVKTVFDLLRPEHRP